MKVNTFEEEFDGAGLKIAIVRARFNKDVTDRMLEACVKTLQDSGVHDDDLQVFEVPGAFEIPFITNELAKKGGLDVIITIGCIQKGETPHDIYISESVISSLQDISLNNSIPVILGIITPATRDQAEVRSTEPNNKGLEAAKAALEIVQVRNKLT